MSVSDRVLFSMSFSAGECTDPFGGTPHLYPSPQAVKSMLKIAMGRVAHLGASCALADVHLPRIAEEPVWILASRPSPAVFVSHPLAGFSFPFPFLSETDREAGAKFFFVGATFLLSTSGALFRSLLGASEHFLFAHMSSAIL